MSEQPASEAPWDARRVRRLRQYLSLTQDQLARELGIRQQTISEWETGIYKPRGASARLLTLVAESAGFSYQAGGSSSKDAKDSGSAADA